MLEPAWLLTGGGSQHCQNKRSSGKGGGRRERERRREGRKGGRRERERRREGRKGGGGERKERNQYVVACEFVAEVLTHSFP